MSEQDEYDRTLRESRANLAADQIGRALDDGTITFEDYTDTEAAKVLASLPTPDLEASTVPTSVRLPFPVHQQLRAYAEAHGTTSSALIRQWVEQMLAADDRPISLADALRVLSNLPPTPRRNAA